MFSSTANQPNASEAAIMRMPIQLLIALILVTSLAGCHQAGPDVTKSEAETPSSGPSQVASPLSDFEKSLQFVRNGSFTYVYVFSRKDGKPLNAEDGQFLRTNAPQVVDWVTTEDKTKVIGGTNFDLEEGNLNLIKKRLVVEDYSGK